MAEAESASVVAASLAPDQHQQPVPVVVAPNQHLHPNNNQVDYVTPSSPVPIQRVSSNSTWTSLQQQQQQQQHYNDQQDVQSLTSIRQNSARLGMSFDVERPPPDGVIAIASAGQDFSAKYAAPGSTPPKKNDFFMAAFASRATPNTPHRNADGSNAPPPENPCVTSVSSPRSMSTVPTPRSASAMPSLSIAGTTSVNAADGGGHTVLPPQSTAALNSSMSVGAPTNANRSVGVGVPPPNSPIARALSQDSKQTFLASVFASRAKSLSYENTGMFEVTAASKDVTPERNAAAFSPVPDEILSPLLPMDDDLDSDIFGDEVDPEVLLDLGRFIDSLNKKGAAETSFNQQQSVAVAATPQRLFHDAQAAYTPGTVSNMNGDSLERREPIPNTSVALMDVHNSSLDLENDESFSDYDDDAVAPETEHELRIFIDSLQARSREASDLKKDTQKQEVLIPGSDEEKGPVESDEEMEDFDHSLNALKDGDGSIIADASLSALKEGDGTKIADREDIDVSYNVIDDNAVNDGVVTPVVSEMIDEHINFTVPTDGLVKENEGAIVGDKSAGMLTMGEAKDSFIECIDVVDEEAEYDVDLVDQIAHLNNMVLDAKERLSFDESEEDFIVDEGGGNVTQSVSQDKEIAAASTEVEISGDIVGVFSKSIEQVSPSEGEGEIAFAESRVDEDDVIEEAELQDDVPDDPEGASAEELARLNVFIMKAMQLVEVGNPSAEDMSTLLEDAKSVGVDENIIAEIFGDLLDNEESIEDSKFDNDDYIVEEKVADEEHITVPQDIESRTTSFAPSDPMSKLEKMFEQRERKILLSSGKFDIKEFWSSPWDKRYVSRKGKALKPKPTAGGNADGTMTVIPPVGGVSSVNIWLRPDTRKSARGKQLRLPVSQRWKKSVEDRTADHSGYLDIQIHSFKSSLNTSDEVHRLDSVIWEERKTQQMFLESSLLNMNWFGKWLFWLRFFTSTLKDLVSHFILIILNLLLGDIVDSRGNIRYHEPICHPKSMEMPMASMPEPGEWTEDWYTTWQSRKDNPNTLFLHERDENENDASNSRGRVWETPEVGTICSVRLKIGENVSRIHYEHSSSIRRSKWRRKYFPRGAFPYS